jgi:hypothetical protein
MISAIGFVSILTGSTLAYAADQYPARAKLLEGVGGALLITGLALIGLRLPYTPSWP